MKKSRMGIIAIRFFCTAADNIQLKRRIPKKDKMEFKGFYN
ncbi:MULTISPECIES: hypothetical protein [Bacillus amyloliquefaciens group]|nr:MULTISPECIES: hypothetical protein [Bacillus amyloliquefaciens group]MDQ8091060.1 hypothetical protein [Bacillus amyloliquefaciens]